MKLSQLKWWHWTLLTIVVAAAIRLATGGPLPFVGRLGLGGGGAKSAAVASAGRPERAPNTGPQMRDVVSLPGFSVSQATPELHRLTIDGSIPNPGNGPGLVDQTGVLVREIGRALQKGVREDSTAITQVRVLVATRGADTAGKMQAHLALYSLTFTAADLYALKSDATPSEALAGAENVVFNSADAHKAMRDWCAVSSNFNAALAFCNQVTAAKGI